MKTRSIVSLAIAMMPLVVRASIMLTPGATYTQDFDTLISSGTSSSLPEGWELFESGTSPNRIYSAGTGSSQAGDTYSFGAEGSTERALGSLRSASVSSVFGATFTVPSRVTALRISYYGEEWRLGTADSADKLQFDYNVGALTVGRRVGWSPFGPLDFATPNTDRLEVGGTELHPRNGNDPAFRTLVSATISGLDIPAGQTFSIRWSDLPKSGSQDGLAIDNFSITAVPEVSTVVAGIGALGMFGLAMRRRSKKSRNAEPGSISL